MSAPAQWIVTACLVVEISWLLANGRSGAILTLMVRNDFDAAVAVPEVVPIHERNDPLGSNTFAAIKQNGVIGPVFRVRNRDSE